jgi:hypothetical protein
MLNQSIANRQAPVILTALLMTAGWLRADINLLNNQANIVGPIQVRLAYTDKNGNGQDYGKHSVKTVGDRQR